MPKPKHILVLRFSAMGDVAMSVPVIRAFTSQYPDVKVTIVTRGFFAPFFRVIKNVEVFEVDLKAKYKGILGLYKLSKELRHLNFDAIADIHNVLRTKILKLFFVGKKVIQIDKGRAEKKALVSGQKFEQLKTTYKRYADVFEKLGFPIDLSNPIFPKKVELDSKSKAFISNLSLPIIGIAPFAAFEGKMYPLEQMKLVIHQLAKNNNIILFGGGSAEILQLNQIEAQTPNTTSVAGKLSLDEELDIISNLNVMLSMDSGNAHIAAMLGVKVVTIWGVTHPFAGFMPFNQPKDYALLANREKYPQIPTSIYGNKQPEGYENAAGSISVESIVTNIESILSN
ncbi:MULTISPECIES: glycosyltransferase family 9 protein [unclassified Winogradskyella]|uniref:glycosyltransferase family 9 protein n=1 Tax=unclassified Winogradskyella TaxID=2615021 RepID=UPI001E51E70B|nr:MULTISPECIES: glycosyltransferase family 9 protein [unclassified Winogradskyella]